MSEGLKTQDLSSLDPTKLTALTPEVVRYVGLLFSFSVVHSS
jgi:hypothetical protein